MADLHTCTCGELTRICRYDVTNEQWATFETFYAMAYDWAADHLPGGSSRDDVEAFAARYAGEEWDSDEPCSFPTFLRLEEDAVKRTEAREQEARRVEQRAEARRRDAKWRADRRRAARRAASA